MSLVATLIANPSNPVLSVALGQQAARHVSAVSHEWLAQGTACDLTLAPGTSASEARSLIKDTLDGAPVDIVIQDLQSRRKKLLIADMDSTMIEQECVDELAAEAGVYEQVAAITRRAMNGEIAFEPALRERVALLGGLDISVVQAVLARRITLTPGGYELVATMKANGAYTALVSGGFTLFTNTVAQWLGFEENRANILHVENDKLTGTLADPILGLQAKVDALVELTSTRGLSVEDALAVGDGANDLGMLRLAGSGTALHAKPIVAAEAKIRIDHGDLTALLYLQGYSQSDFVKVTE